MMEFLKPFGNLDIDWGLTPEDAVTMYLEWGNNNWRGDRAPVRSQTDESVYFVVDAWEDPPVVRLIRRNAEESRELVSFPLPPDLLPVWREENGRARGVFAPGKRITAWLRERVESA